MRYEDYEFEVGLEEAVVAHFNVKSWQLTERDKERETYLSVTRPLHAPRLKREAAEREGGVP